MLAVRAAPASHLNAIFKPGLAMGSSTSEWLWFGFLDHIVGEGFVRGAHRDMLLVSESPQTLIDTPGAWQPTVVPTWTERKPD
jgi:hypothetical protein